MIDIYSRTCVKCVLIRVRAITSHTVDGICDIEKKCCEINNLGKFQVLFQILRLGFIYKNIDR